MYSLAIFSARETNPRICPGHFAACGCGRIAKAEAKDPTTDRELPSSVKSELTINLLWRRNSIEAPLAVQFDIASHDTSATSLLICMADGNRWDLFL
jgi:hypothetical protein